MYGWWGLGQRTQAQIAAIQMNRSFSGLSIILLGFVVLVPVFIVGIFIIPFVFCLPLWQRTFLHPNVIKLHTRRARITTGTGIAAFILYIISGFLGFHDWTSNGFTTYLVGLGIFLSIIGILTILIGWIQLEVSKAYPEKTHGNGYGLLNLYCVFTKYKPSHIFTILQDSGIVCFFLYPALISSKEEILAHFIISLPIICILLSYTWYCQVKFSDGNSVRFRNSTDT